MALKFADEKALIKFVLAATLPEWKKKLFKKFSDAIQVHSQGQIFYKIDRLFPNETPEAKAHRILSFESVTEASFLRAANNVNRVFKNSSYSVEASEKTIDLLTPHNYDDDNFYNWFLDQWTEVALKTDANARFVIYPPEYVKQYEKQPCVFFTSDLLIYESEEAVIFISEDESVVEYEIAEHCVEDVVFYDQSINKPNVRQSQKNTYTPKLEKKIKRRVYHAFFLGGFYRIEEVQGNQKEYEIEFFPIKQLFIPVQCVGGTKGHKDVNKSFLYPFVSFGNLALLQHSQHTAVNFTFAFPRMSEIEGPCEAVGCVNGSIECTTDEDLQTYGDKKPCRKCNGTGFVAVQSPYKIYKKRYDPAGMEGDNEHLKVPDVQYYTPETAILDYSKAEWKDYLEMAELAVYIQQKIKTGNVEAAKSKEIDRDDLYSFLAGVGKMLFSKMRFAIQCFENYYVANPVQVVVSPPYSLAILTEGEAFTELKTILESGVPVVIKAKQVDSFINKFVSKSSPIRKFFEVLKIVDPLLYYTSTELLQFKLGGVVSPERFANHVYAYPILERLYQEDRSIFLEETKAIVAKLITELEKEKPAPVEDLKTALLKNNK